MLNFKITLICNFWYKQNGSAKGQNDIWIVIVSAGIEIDSIDFFTNPYEQDKHQISFKYNF